MAKQSAGILLYRYYQKELEVLLVHPGGPFFARKDLGAWTIPKGEILPDEDPLEAAKREFEEETGQPVNGDFIALTPIKQKGGKIVLAWALEGDIETDKIISNTFTILWPPGSAQSKTFPEIDRAAWFPIAEARQKMNEKQVELLDDLNKKLPANQ